MGKVKQEVIELLNIYGKDITMNYADMYAKSKKEGTVKEISSISKTEWETGEIVIGKLLDISPVEFTNDNDEKHTANKYTLETDDGNISCILGRITDLNYTLEIDSIYAITSMGQGKCKKGKVNLFKIEHIGKG